MHGCLYISRYLYLKCISHKQFTHEKSATLIPRHDGFFFNHIQYSHVVCTLQADPQSVEPKAFDLLFHNCMAYATPLTYPPP